MAVGKGSMARASKAASKTDGSAGVKKSRKAAAKPAVSGVVGAASKEVVEKIVYQSSSQMLDRDAKPGETFAIGDAMPVYFF